MSEAKDALELKGEVAPDFEPVAESLHQVIRRGGGGAICVYHRGVKVVDVWAGTRDTEGNPWLPDTMAVSFSTTKGVMSTLVHQLVDDGLLDYDDPVMKHWPEFGQAGKESITVRQVLSHRAGLPDVSAVVAEARQVLDWDAMTRALARARPQVRPGRPSAYHALTFGWLAGEIARRVSGLSIQELVRTRLAEPLGLDGLYIGAPPEVHSRAAELRSNDAALQGPVPRFMERVGVLRGLSAATRLVGLNFDPDLFRRALLIPGNPAILFEREALGVPIPAANGLFTARSLARLYAALGAGGSLDGTRILSTETLRRATEIQTRSPDRVLAISMGWRLGYHSAFTMRGRIRGAFGHFGYGGSGAFADPKRQLAVALVNNSAGGTPMGDVRIGSVADAALRAARRTRRREALAADGEGLPEIERAAS